MDKGLLHKYTSRLETEDQAGNVLDLEGTEDCGCFGYLRGLRERAVMLELRKRNGNILAIAYSWIDRIEFNPSEGVTISAAGTTVRIRGQNLNAEVRPLVRLFELLARGRATWIGEGPGSAVAANDCRVESLQW